MRKLNADIRLENEFLFNLTSMLLKNLYEISDFEALQEAQKIFSLKVFSKQQFAVNREIVNFAINFPQENSVVRKTEIEGSSSRTKDTDFLSRSLLRCGYTLQILNQCDCIMIYVQEFHWQNLSNNANKSGNTLRIYSNFNVICGLPKLKSTRTTYIYPFSYILLSSLHNVA